MAQIEVAWYHVRDEHPAPRVDRRQLRQDPLVAGHQLYAPGAPGIEFTPDGGAGGANLQIVVAIVSGAKPGGISRIGIAMRPGHRIGRVGGVVVSIGNVAYAMAVDWVPMASGGSASRRHATMSARLMCLKSVRSRAGPALR